MRKPLLLPRLLAALAAAGLPVSALAAPPATVIEYLNAATRTYVLVSGASEAASLDRGSPAGWSRTGGQFSVWKNRADDPKAKPVCLLTATGSVAPKPAFLSINPAECRAARASGQWADSGTAFFAYAADEGACPAGSTAVWRVPQPTGNGAPAHDRYTVESTIASRTGKQLPEPAFCVPVSAEEQELDARRLLRQATFGATAADVQEVLRLGPAAWVDRQLALATTPYTDYPPVPSVRPDTCVNDRTLPLRPDSFCARDNYSLFPLQTELFRQALAQPDQLRGRVAWALSQLFVVSGVENGRNYAARQYQQMLRDHAFGNYLRLLHAVTVSPVMGDYLDMVNNNRETATTTPNENYAREVLQLFSIGLQLLNQDGTPELDAEGKPIPTFDLGEIKGFARAFTGWTYPTAPGATPRNNNPRYYLGNMRPVAATHDFGAKPLLDDIDAPANLTVEQDLEFALRNIFLHPNVAPFISKQLIQKLVTSNPSPGYVERVADAFDNNGSGVRGDLSAVVRAILLDPEARGARKADPTYGKLTEPVVWMTRVLRAFGGSTDGVYPRAQSATLSQPAFYSPSVFNYFSPRYMIPGAGVSGPEFAILGTSTAIARANVANTLVYTTRIAPDPTVYGATGTALDFSAWLASAGDANALVERIDRELMERRMTAAMKSAMAAAVNAVPTSNSLARVRAAAWLAVTSPQFSVER